MDWIDALIIAIVEGITEFLPISSTGHMIITKELMCMADDKFLNLFIINIQFGAILSVVVLYWKRFLKSLTFYYKLFVAFLPAAFIGFFIGDYIDSLLESPLVVAISLIVGGVILVFVDQWFKKAEENKEVSYGNALKIGFFQVIAMIPGVSRSAATIIGGMTQKLTRKNAAEFSFFLAVPTMFAASVYKIYKNYEVITASNISVLIFGNVIAFIVAMIAIRSFIYYLSRNGFKLFGYYRIIVGIAILLLIAFDKLN